MGRAGGYPQGHRRGVNPENKGKGKATQAVQAGRRAEWTGLGEGQGGIVNPPVWRASTILYDSVAELKGGTKTNEDGKLFYGRRGTPTQP
jgi:cysteine-S-conjugate beta-lyase